MIDPRLQPLLDLMAANIAAAVMAEMGAGADRFPIENGAESGQEQRRREEQASESLSPFQTPDRAA